MVAPCSNRKIARGGARTASHSIVPTPISLRRATFSCLLGFFTFVAAASDAQNHDRRGRDAEEAGVALQPFTLDGPAPARLGHYAPRSIPRAEPVRLAYYAPRAIPRAEPVVEHNQPDAIPQRAPAVSGPTVNGRRAVLRNGIAYAPSNAPATVKSAIWAANTLRRKPYVWGGGHGSFDDYGYDCSGTVSFALHHAGLLGAPLPSSDFLGYGERGRGKWITVYARRGHTFAVIAGLRLDTTDLRYGSDIGPRWHTDFRDTRGFDARHPVGL
jgi:cell wall-associated NlpC family hydrolase